MPSLYLIRGVSGSGKTTFAKDFAFHLGCNYWEADMYFDREDGYNFNPAQVGVAHDWCYKNFLYDVFNRHSVVVSNTFTKAVDMDRYIFTAREHGYSVTSLVVENRHNNKDIHNVPESSLQRQETFLRNNLKLR